MFRSIFIAGLVFMFSTQVEAVVQPEDIVFELEKTACYGACPVYKLKINGHGRVYYEGIKHVRVKGKASDRISKKDVVKLVNKALEAHFFTRQAKYIDGERLGQNKDGEYILLTVTTSDLPTTTLKIKLAEREHSVMMYSDVPPQLRELVEFILETVKVNQWVEQ